MCFLRICYKKMYRTCIGLEGESMGQQATFDSFYSWIFLCSSTQVDDVIRYIMYP